MSNLHKLLNSKIALVILIVVAAFLFKSEYSAWQKRKSIELEITTLQNQQNVLEQKNQELAKSLDYLNTSDYKEKIARQQLNLQKKGELAINFPDTLSSQNLSTINSEQNQKNWEKWWLYFFKD